MKLDMMEQYVLGCFIALVLGYILLQRFTDKNIKKAAPRDAGVEACPDKVVREADGPPDVVIVGAGVAGSALAYTLAKVCLNR